MRRVIGLLLVVGLGLLSVMRVGAAYADTGGSAVTDDGGVSSEAENGEGSSGGSSSGHRCEYEQLEYPTDAIIFDDDGEPIEADGTGFFYEQWCDGEFWSIIYISPRNPTELLEEARRYLPLPLPEPQLSPVGDQIVNLPTWMWLTSGWSSENSSVAVPGIAVTVNADPVSATWSMGDGSLVVCDGPGTPYDPAAPSSAQAPTCIHTYTRSSASQSDHVYPVSVTVRWHATWDVSGFPGGGDLGTIDRTTTFSVRVGEVQAVNTRTN